jgi:Holliday junction resolvase RusA-like endonuclease
LVLLYVGWTKEQLAEHPQLSKLLRLKAAAPLPVPATSEQGHHRFVLKGDPMGKPRMTQRDKWQKRPVVLRYRQYCDDLRAASGPVPADVYGLRVCAHIATPPSWSKKKRDAHLGQLHQQKPDWDNIGKAVSDALFADDSVVADGRVLKFWCAEGEQRTEVDVLYAVTV